MLFTAMANFLHKNSKYPIYLWEWRKARGLTADRLAEEAGIQRSLLSAIETGARRANVDQLLAIASVLNMHPGQLFRSPDDPVNSIESRLDKIPPKMQRQAIRLFDAFIDDTTTV